MKKKVLSLIIVSALLMLVSWIQIGKALGSQKSKAVILVSNPRVAIPDYRMDAVFFDDWYRDVSLLQEHLRIPDYPVDAKIYYDKYLNKAIFSENVKFLDYPLDGKFFVDHYAILP